MPNSVPSSRWGKRSFCLVSLFFGITGFIAGRFSVHHNVAVVESITNVDSRGSSTNVDTSISQRTGRPSTRPSAVVVASASWDETQWQKILAEPGSPARNATLVMLIEKLAKMDPDRAMVLAQAERNLKLRENLVQAALRGWAQVSSTNAANWALALSDSNNRETALSSVFAGAVAANPDQAVQLGKTLVQQHPNDALSFGARLIEALCDTGNFETATQMAVDGGQTTREAWMAAAYSRWAEYQPESAAKAANQISDLEARNQALHGIVGGWSENDPVALVQFVTQLPSEVDRGALLGQSLEQWAKHDPEAASNWINNHEGGADLDRGIAAVATMESIQPEIAVGWAESMVNPALRSETLAAVIRNWMTSDLSAAKRYFETTKKLSPEDRTQLAEVIAGFSHD